MHKLKSLINIKFQNFNFIIYNNHITNIIISIIYNFWTQIFYIFIFKQSKLYFSYENITQKLFKKAETNKNQKNIILNLNAIHSILSGKKEQNIFKIYKYLQNFL